jgi:tyrosyl-tRNA synthetase
MGKKMGKTEKGAVWLDAQKVSPFEYYQYWVNVHDADTLKLMKLYTFMSLEEIETYADLEGADLRKAKHRLALEATTLAHGEEAAHQAQKSAMALFSGGATDQMPTHILSFPCGVVEALVESGLCKSKGDARRQIKGKAIKLDLGQGKVAIDSVDHHLEEPCVLWFGKKKCVRLTHQG